jgi:2-methylcitrate dehydratase PrpD
MVAARLREGLSTLLFVHPLSYQAAFRSNAAVLRLWVDFDDTFGFADFHPAAFASCSGA